MAVDIPYPFRHLGAELKCTEKYKADYNAGFDWAKEQEGELK